LALREALLQRRLVTLELAPAGFQSLTVDFRVVDIADGWRCVTQRFSMPVYEAGRFDSARQYLL